MTNLYLPLANRFMFVQSNAVERACLDEDASLYTSK